MTRLDGEVTGHTAVVYGAEELVVGPMDPAGASSGDPPGGAGIERHHDGAVAIVDGRVEAVGPTEAVVRSYPPETADHAVDAAGSTVVPGFVDAHTHALFAGDRSDEFAAKLRGRTYQELLEEGGGILRTVRAVRDASDDVLLSNLLGHLDVMLAHGTTTVEVKSGYGLDRATERRMLAVIDRANARHPIEVVPTFMGAHAVPDDRTADEYVDDVVENQLPAVADQGVAEFCDVFCEEGVFTVDQSRRVLQAGLEVGLTPKIHAEEFARLGGAQLAADLDAASADHLLHANDDDVEALVESGVVPVLLPGTAFGIGVDYPDASRFRSAGAKVAIATDFNPNCHSQAMHFALSLACVECGFTPAEAIVAATRHGALALDRHNRGSLRPGHRGDLVVLDAPSHVHVPYSYGVNRVDQVLIEGQPVHPSERRPRSGRASTHQRATREPNDA